MFSSYMVMLMRIMLRTDANLWGNTGKENDGPGKEK